MYTYMKRGFCRMNISRAVKFRKTWLIAMKKKAPNLHK